jgi:hypothetical protein
MTHSTTEPLYDGKILDVLDEMVGRFLLSPEEQPAHPPNQEHWAGCSHKWCRDLYEQWVKLGEEEA